MLQPLTPYTGAGNPTIRCCDCITHMPYSLAQEAGWHYDPQGVPFFAYFCPNCTRRFRAMYENQKDGED